MVMALRGLNTSSDSMYPVLCGPSEHERRTGVDLFALRDPCMSDMHGDRWQNAETPRLSFALRFLNGD